MAKINISIDDNLLERLDNYADLNYMTRSGVITSGLIQLFAQADVITSINKLSLAFQKIADTGEVDEATRKELEDYKRFSELFLQKK